VFEKNHFPGGQNRSTVLPMIEHSLSKPQLWLLLMVAILVVATIAPMAILAA
jgi:hypothetical protein